MPGTICVSFRELEHGIEGEDSLHSGILSSGYPLTLLRRDETEEPLHGPRHRVLYQHHAILQNNRVFDCRGVLEASQEVAKHHGLRIEPATIHQEEDGPPVPARQLYQLQRNQLPVHKYQGGNHRITQSHDQPQIDQEGTGVGE